MRVHLCATRSFGLATLRLLRSRGDEVVRITTRPGDALLRDYGGHLELEPAKCDLVVCAHYYGMVPAEVREAAELGAIGYHPSLLPNHRGRTAVEDTIAAGDDVAGGSIYWLTDGWDEGPIAASAWVPVQDGDDASTLWRRDLFGLGLRLLDRVLDDLAEGVVVKRPQSLAPSPPEE